MSHSLSTLKNAPKEQREAFLELARRERILSAVIEPAHTFEAQRRFIEDTASLVAAQCSRRAGKTMGIARKILRVVYKNPGASLLYINLTSVGAKRQLKKDCLDVVLTQLGLKWDYNKSENYYTFDNGAVLYMLGMDANEKEREKALGQKYALVIVDEGQSYKTDLEDLIYRVLKPAVADYRGQIYLTGTPCNHVHSFYYRVVTGQERGWSVHKWLTQDNPFMTRQWEEEIADLKERKPGVETTAWFRQQYLNEWVIDPDKLVYKFDPTRDLIDTLPPGKYRCALGIDLGWDDNTSFTLVAYKDYDPVAYVLESWKKRHMTLDAVENEVKQYQKDYPNLGHIVIDNSAKQSVETMKHRTGIGFVAAEKTGKADFIEILNSDMKLGNIKLLRGTTEQLQGELQALVWDEKKLIKGIKVEQQSCANHCADGFLYAYRFCYHWVDRGLAPIPETLDQRVEIEDEEEFAAQESGNWWER